MDWLKRKICEDAESITKLPTIKFSLMFIGHTLKYALYIVVAPLFVFFWNLFEKAKVVPEDDHILLIMCLFLGLWLVITIIFSTFIFNFNGKLIRYDLHEDRLYSLIESGLISKTQKRIWLIGLSLLPFTSEGWFKILKRKIKEGVEVRLLIFDPNTQFATDRPSSLVAGGSSLSHDIREAIKKLKDFKTELDRDHPTFSNHFEVHLYKGNASMSCFILDDEARLGIYLAESTGLTAPEIRVTKRATDKDFFEMIEANFQTIWNSSTNMNNANE